MSPMTKSLLFLQFLLASLRATAKRTTVINNNIDERGPGPPQFNFFNQFKSITWVKLRIFALKMATQVLISPFHERTVITKAGFTV